MNPIACISINHRTAPVAVREKITIKPGDLAALLGESREAYTINTCNRTEVYSVGLDRSAVYARLQELSGIGLAALKESSEVFEAREALRHLFQLAAGMDSLVLGEPQILGQVKEAYREALAAKTTGIYLDKALHRAFRAAKRVRSETGIGTYPVSVASEAVELAGHIFDDIKKSRVLVIGAGDMACIAARRLKDKGVKEIAIVNRTYASACQLACELGGEPREFEHLFDELARADIVISSTAASRPIIGKGLMAEVMKQRRGSPIIIIDIAVPRDVEPEVGKLYNCYLYDIDALKAIVDRHYANRQLHLDNAHTIIEHEIEVFERWLESLTAQATIKDLYALMQTYVQDQLKGMGYADSQRDDMEQAIQTVLKRFLHRPVSFLKDHPGIKHIEYTRRIFQLDEDYQDRHKG